VVAVLLQPRTAAQSVDLDALARRPVPLRTGIGVAHDAVTTTSKEAQAYYDQGLANLHSYVWLEAARSFNQALGIDPSLAMAYVGLTYAYAELNRPAMARDALTRAKALEANVADHERRHIDARALQMDAESSPRDGTKLAAYRSALDAALAQYPRDEELLLARGHAESSDPAERGQGAVAGSVAYYEKALAIAPSHFAGHHYLTHAYENAGRIDEASAEGALYAKLAASVPHAHHMRGHDLRRVGRIHDAIEEFAAADALASAYLKAEAIPPSLDWNYQHNLDLLATSYQYAGLMSKAEPIFKQSFDIPSTLVVQEFNKREWPVFLLSRGRIDDALAAAKVLVGHASPLVAAIGHVEAGHAHLAQRQFQAATGEANAALQLIRGAEGGGLVATPLQTLQGEFFLRTGDREKGRTMLRDAVRKMRLAPGPDAWTQALFGIEAIARAAREADDWELAAWAARQMVEHDARYAGSHYAAALAARHDGDEKTAHAEFALAAQYWSGADPGLPELQTIRSGLR